MTFEQAVQQLPVWVQYWVWCQLLGAFLLPFALLIWRESRLPAVFCLLAGLGAGLATNALYNAMGYTKLIGLGHILFWTPLAIYLVWVLRRRTLRPWPKWITVAIVATILVSLAFDYADMVRYLLGERAPLALPPAMQ